MPKVGVIKGGGGKSRLGRALNRTSLPDKLLACAIGNGACYEVVSRRDTSKLVNVANSPVLAKNGRSRVYVEKDGKTTSELVNLGDPEALFRQLIKNGSLKTFNHVIQYHTHAEVISHLQTRPGQYFYCSDNQRRALSLANWEPPKTHYHQSLIDKTTYIVDTGVNGDGGWLQCDGIFAQIGVAVSTANKQVVVEAEKGSTLGSQGVIYYLKSIFADAEYLDKRPIFDLLPYISFEENTKAPLFYVGAALSEPNSDIATMVKARLREDIVRLINMGATGYAEKAKRKNDESQEDVSSIESQNRIIFDSVNKLHDLLGGFTISDETFREQVLSQLIVIDRADKALSNAKDDADIIEALTAFKKAFKPLFTIAPSYEGFDAEKAHAAVKLLVEISCATPETKGGDAADSLEGLDTVEGENPKGEGLVRSALEAVNRIVRAGAMTHSTCILIGTALTDGEVSSLDMALSATGANQGDKTSAREYRECLAKKVLTYAGVLEKVPFVEVSNKPLPASKTDFVWYDSNTGSIKSTTKTPLQHLSQANLCLLDSLGSYAFVESNNPGSMGFNNDIKNALTNNLSAGCIWFYPPAAPMDLHQSVGTLSMIQDVAEDADMEEAYKLFRLRDKEAFVRDAGEVDFKEMKSKEPLLSQDLRQITDGIVYFTNLCNGSGNSEVNSSISTILKQHPELKVVAEWDSNVLATAAAVASVALAASTGTKQDLQVTRDKLIAASHITNDATVFDTAYMTSRDTDRRYIYVLATPLDINGIGMCVRCNKGVYFFTETVGKVAPDIAEPSILSKACSVDVESYESFLNTAFFEPYAAPDYEKPFAGLIEEVNGCAK